jgi:hypothetical protein
MQQTLIFTLSVCFFTFESAVVIYTPQYEGGGCSNIASYHWSVYYNITDV